MTRRIFRSIMLIAGAVLLCALVIVMGMFYTYSNNIQSVQLRDELNLAASGTEQGGMDYLQTLDGQDFRITWIQSDGTVLFDTHASTATMESHLDRQEIQMAMQYGYGSSVRYSNTLLERQSYEAKLLSDGTVLRISVTRKSLLMLVVGMLYPACVIAGVTMIVSAILARKTADKIVAPLEKLDLEHPLQDEVYPELSPLLRRIQQQNDQIQGQIRELRQKKDEFDQITANMGEALVVLDRRSIVLSMNPAAKRLFEAEDSAIGGPFYQVDRHPDMQTAIAAAFAEGNCELKGERSGKIWQFFLSRISSGTDTMALMILALDITDVENGEMTRREFTANVSHELKNPLQTIIGSAELLENGLVKPEDTGRFVTNIHKEATRLMNLIEDVIRLSHLDEGVKMPTEDVDLYEISEQAVRSVQFAAEQHNVTIQVTGEHEIVHGVRNLLYEIVENLCSNAVKYNVNNGSVTVNVATVGGHAVLSVSDTGIGISPEDQNRVFERFYRVDKSHSRATGGTGLGLSIVKHAVQYHNGKLSLVSTPGVGTTITVTF